MFFDELVRVAEQRNLGEVDALSACSGLRSSHRKVSHVLNSRWSDTYLDELVDIYSRYNFALVFENKDWPGYVTEKIVSAFLAGSIPIYWGNQAALEIFNPRAFIYVGDSTSTPWDAADLPLRFAPALEKIAYLARNATAYRSIHAEPAVTSASLARFFSWHSTVEGTLPLRVQEAVFRVLHGRRLNRRFRNGQVLPGG